MPLEYCYDCGKQKSTSAPACPHCGAPSKRPLTSAAGARAGSRTAVRSAKSRSTAILLALFLGGAGIHWFYLERPGRGVLYLMFCWTFIPVFLALINTIQFLSLSDAQFQERYSS